MERFVGQNHYMAGEPFVCELNPDFGTDNDHAESRKTGRYQPRSNPTRVEANARLIAAAPAYYAAAEQVAEAMASLLAEARETLTEEYPHEMRRVEASLASLASAHAAAKGKL